MPIFVELFQLFTSGQCGCAKNAVKSALKVGENYAIVSWSQPENFTCPHKHIMIRKQEMSKYSSPHLFPAGRYNIPYMYFLYGGKKSICYVHINVEGRITQVYNELMLDISYFGNISWVFGVSRLRDGK